MRVLQTAEEVFDALHGVKAVADLTKRDYDAAWNWKKIGTFPPNTYVVMIGALEAQGDTAPASLWRMVGAEDQRAAS